MSVLSNFITPTEIKTNMILQDIKSLLTTSKQLQKRIKLRNLPLKGLESSMTRTQFQMSEQLTFIPLDFDIGWSCIHYFNFQLVRLLLSLACVEKWSQRRLLFYFRGEHVCFLYRLFFQKKWQLNQDNDKMIIKSFINISCSYM